MTGVFWVVGALVLLIGLSIPTAVEGGLFSSRRTEMIFLGVFFMVSPLLSLAWVRLWVRRANRDTIRLIESGLRATALVVSRTDTGQMVNNAPKVEYELEVTVQGREPYRATVVDHVSLLDLARTEPGSMVDVLVDPDDPGNIVIWREGEDREGRTDA